MTFYCMFDLEDPEFPAVVITEKDYYDANEAMDEIIPDDLIDVLADFGLNEVSENTFVDEEGMTNVKTFKKDFFKTMAANGYTMIEKDLEII